MTSHYHLEALATLYLVSKADNHGVSAQIKKYIPSGGEKWCTENMYESLGSWTCLLNGIGQRRCLFKHYQSLFFFFSTNIKSNVFWAIKLYKTINFCFWGFPGNLFTEDFDRKLIFFRFVFWYKISMLKCSKVYFCFFLACLLLLWIFFQNLQYNIFCYKQLYLKKN